MGHSAIDHLAEGSNDLRRRVQALRAGLRQTATRMARYERVHRPPLGRSAAFASRALLRLDPEFEDLPIDDIRRRVAATWANRAGGTVTADGFRQHLEISAVYERFAGEFRRFAHDLLDEAGVEMAELEIHDPERDEPAVAEAKASLSRVARRIWDLEAASFRQRLNSIRDGIVRVRNEDEMLSLLVLLTELAEHELQAVDRIDIFEWYGNPRLNDYLRLQLRRARERDVTLERIRLVEPDEFNDERGRDQLTKFIQLHDEASATLLLCPVQDAEDLGTCFHPRMGVLVVDPTSDPCAVTGWVGDGRVERALVYTRTTDALAELQVDYAHLRTRALDRDPELRERLLKLRGPTG